MCNDFQNAFLKNLMGDYILNALQCSANVDIEEKLQCEHNL